MIDRAIIEEVMAGATQSNPDDPDGIEDRNALRRQAVEEFLDGNLEADMPATQGRTARELILSDLTSYQEWEHG